MRPSHFVINLAIAFFQYFATTLTALFKVRRVLLRMLQRILIKCAIICRIERQLFPKCNWYFGHLTDKHTLNSVSKMQINANLWHKTAAFFFLRKRLEIDRKLKLKKSTNCSSSLFRNIPDRFSYRMCCASSLEEADANVIQLPSINIWLSLEQIWNNLKMTDNLVLS